MQLDLLLGENRFIVSPARLNSPLMIPPLFFGDVTPVSLRLWQKGANGIYSVDPASYQTSLLFGVPNTRPELGFWTLTTTAGTSKPIAVRASSSEVMDALVTAFGPGEAIVTGGSGSYIITLAAPGNWALPSAAFQGDTLSGVLIFPITSGTATTPAQYRIEVLEVAPARIIPAGWTPGNTNPVCTFEQIDGQLWSLILDPETDNGFFTLTVDGVTTRFISWFGAAYDIAQSLAAIGEAANVQVNGSGGFWVQFFEPVTTASVGGHLVILPSVNGALDLTSTGIRELLDGLQFAVAKLTIVLVKDGQTITASADVVLNMPVNQPATVTIDSPQMAGLTFAISNDQAYMLVLQNGIMIGEIALNAPSAVADVEQPQLAFAVSSNNADMQIFPNGQHGYDVSLSNAT